MSWLASVPAPGTRLTLAVLPLLAIACGATFTDMPSAVRALLPGLSGLVCGVVVASLYGQWLLEGRLTPACEFQTLRISGTVEGLATTSVMPDGTLRQRFVLGVDAVSPQRCAGPRRIALSWYSPNPPSPGERWQFDATVKRPWGLANPGAYNAQDWFARERIDALGTVKKRAQARLLDNGASLQQAHHAVRQRIAARIEQIDMEPASAGLLRALAVGDRTALAPVTREQFQRLGVSHLLVISGLHIGLVGGMGLLAGHALVLLSGGRGGAWLPPASALLAAGGYAALAAFSLPTQRALLMLAVFVLAGATGRVLSPVNTLLLAAAAVMLANPLAATGSGLWLSFGAVAALVWFSRWQPGTGKIRRIGSTQAYMSLVMLPLGGWFFAGGSLVAPLANLLLIPLVGCVVVPAVLLGVVFCLVGLPWEAGPWRFAARVLELSGNLGESVLGVLGNVAWMPLSVSRFALLLGLIAVALIALPVGRRLRLCLVLLSPLLLPVPVSPSIEPGTVRVTALDVGQGTSVIVRSGSRTLVYDTGGGVPGGRNLAQNVVIPYLLQAGVRELDTVVISHSDLDHSAGAGELLLHFPTRRVRYGRDVALPAGRHCRAGEVWQWPGGPTFRTLSPAYESPATDNDASCVLQIVSGGMRLLLPGDIGREREREVLRYWAGEARSHWLLVGHHGSATSSGRTWLRGVAPTLAIVTRGYANPFGHPHPTVMENLAARDITVLDTAISGALEFEFRHADDPASGGDGDEIIPRVRSWREHDTRYWR